MEIKSFSLGDVFTRCYVVSKNNKAFIVDPGAEAEKIFSYLKNNDLKLEFIINTHGHFDHIGANEFLKNKTNAEIYIHDKAAEKLISAKKNLSLKFLRRKIISPPADRLLKDGDQIIFEDYTMQVLYTPGHSRGGISIYIPKENILFSGDAVFSNGVGRTDLADSSREKLHESIKEKLLVLTEDTKIFPGHGESFLLKDFKEDVYPKFFGE